MKNDINEDQVEEYIAYNIRQVIETNGITKDEAVESVRYYMDYLVNQVAGAMED